VTLRVPILLKTIMMYPGSATVPQADAVPRLNRESECPFVLISFQWRRLVCPYPTSLSRESRPWRFRKCCVLRV